MTQANMSRVAIVGHGPAAWMSAAFLATLLGPSADVTLIEPEAAQPLPTAVAAMPPFKAFNHHIGLTEGQFLVETSGTVKLGTEFVNWGRLGNRYFHPFGQFGTDFDAVALHQWWLMADQDSGGAGNLDDLSMSWALVQEGRFGHPHPDRRMIQSTYDYGYHFDPALYGQLLAEVCARRGVKHLRGDITDTHRDPQSGALIHVTLADGRQIEADVFVDCTSGGSLIGGVMGVDWIDWSDHLPCDTMMDIACQSAGDPSPATRVTQRDAGWQGRMPLQSCVSHSYVYAKAQISDALAQSALMENLDGRPMGEPKVHALNQGKRKACASANVFAIGPAAGCLEPLEGCDLHLVQTALSRLAALWPSSVDDRVVTAEFNALCDRDWDLTRDFHILHYHASSRRDTAFHRAVAEAVIPDTLAQRLAHWSHAGRLISPGPEAFQATSWLAVLVGQGLKPQACEPLAHLRAGQVDFQARLNDLRKVIATTAPTMPMHSAWLRGIGGSR